MMIPIFFLLLYSSCVSLFVVLAVKYCDNKILKKINKKKKTHEKLTTRRFSINREKYQPPFSPRVYLIIYCIINRFLRKD